MARDQRRGFRRDSHATALQQHAGDTGGRCDGGNLGRPHHFVCSFTVDTRPLLETNADKHGVAGITGVTMSRVHTYMFIWLFDYDIVLREFGAWMFRQPQQPCVHAGR